jgi:hypothetical protein
MSATPILSISLLQVRNYSGNTDLDILATLTLPCSGNTDLHILQLHVGHAQPLHLEDLVVAGSPLFWQDWSR